MHILVTGGAGFIGSHLTDALLSAGHEVTVIDNLTSGCRQNVHPDAEFIHADIRSDTLGDIFSSRHFDAVYHEAAQTLVPVSIENPRLDADENIMGLLNVLECCRHTNVGKVIFSSSAAIYGDNVSLPLTEQEIPDPTSFYGLTKWMTEKYLALYKKLFGLDYTVLRYSNVYGPRQGIGGEGGVVFIFAKALAEGLPLTIFGDGKQTRDFISVRDIVSANMAALTRGNGCICNISTQTETVLKDLADMMIRLTGGTGRIEWGPARAGDILRSSLCCTAAAEQLHWKPQVSLEDGLVETCRYFSHS